MNQLVFLKSRPTENEPRPIELSLTMNDRHTIYSSFSMLINVDYDLGQDLKFAFLNPLTENISQTTSLI